MANIDINYSDTYIESVKRFLRSDDVAQLLINNEFDEIYNLAYKINNGEIDFEGDPQFFINIPCMTTIFLAAGIDVFNHITRLATWMIYGMHLDKFTVTPEMTIEGYPFSSHANTSIDTVIINQEINVVKSTWVTNFNIVKKVIFNKNINNFSDIQWLPRVTEISENQRDKIIVPDIHIITPFPNRVIYRGTEDQAFELIAKPTYDDILELISKDPTYNNYLPFMLHNLIITCEGKDKTLEDYVKKYCQD